MRALLRDATSDSFVMVDELGRGTSSRDGAAVAGALLETLDDLRAAGIFATHLHELLQLPLELSPRVSRRRMGVRWAVAAKAEEEEEEEEERRWLLADGEGDGDALVTAEPIWTYQLEEGICTDSLALHTARRFGLSESMLSRAATLATSFDAACRSTQATAASGLTTAAASVSSASSASSSASSLGRETSLRFSPAYDGRVAERAIDMVLRFMSDERESESGIGGKGGDDSAGAVRPTRVPPGWTVPPSLSAGVSCVYVIEAPVDGPGGSVGSGAGDNEGGRDRCCYYYYYVGETDAMAQRLEQHRRKKPAEGGGPGTVNWADSSVIIVPARNKSRARALEVALIQALAAAGLPMLSTNDVNHRHFSK